MVVVETRGMCTTKDLRECLFSFLLHSLTFLVQPVPEGVGAAKKGPGCVEEGEATEQTPADARSNHPEHKDPVHAEHGHVLAKEWARQEHGKVNDAEYGAILSRVGALIVRLDRIERGLEILKLVLDNMLQGVH